MRSVLALAILVLAASSFAYVGGSGFEPAYLNYYYGAQNCKASVSYYLSGQESSKGDGTVVFYKYTDDGIEIGQPAATNGTIPLSTMSSWLSSNDYQHTEEPIAGVDNGGRMLEARNVCREYVKSAADAMVLYIDFISPYASPAEGADLKEKKKFLEKASSSLGPGAAVSEVVSVVDNADGDWEETRKTASEIAPRAACTEVNSALASESSLANAVEGEIKIAEIEGRDISYARALLIGARAMIGSAFEKCSAPSLESAEQAQLEAKGAADKLRQALAEIDMARNGTG